jgi:hypothetical protein
MAFFAKKKQCYDHFFAKTSSTRIVCAQNDNSSAKCFGKNILKSVPDEEELKNEKEGSSTSLNLFSTKIITVNMSYVCSHNGASKTATNSVRNQHPTLTFCML